MKGNTITPRGIIVSPYRKPNVFERILMKIRGLFERPKKLKKQMERSMKDTLIVNLYGGPGTGKSSGAAYIFSKLKMAGVDAEYVTEFAKDKVWEGSQEAFKCQFYITGKQAFRVSRCFGKVDVIVTDSPIRLGKIYADLIDRKQLGLACVEEADRYRGNTIEIFLERVKPYNPNGRNQTEEESKEIDKSIRKMLDDQGVPYAVMRGEQSGYDQVFDHIMQELAFRNMLHSKG